MIFKLDYFGYQAIEKAPFEIHRPEGSARYIFFHFNSSVKIVINDKCIDAPPGSCIIYEPRVPQHFFVERVNLNHDYLDFTCLNGLFFKEIRFPLNTILSPMMSSYISSIIEKIHSESNSNRLGSEYMIDSLMKTLFVSISRKLHNFTFSSIEYERTLQRKFEKIRLELYHDPGLFTVTKMASKLDFSLSHFGSLYKKFFNTTPVSDLTNARIAFIKNANLSALSMYDISTKLGFESIEYFYRWFKQKFETTPSEYFKKTKLGDYNK
jgi:AraC-like DNA-binding protein